MQTFCVIQMHFIRFKNIKLLTNYKSIKYMFQHFDTLILLSSSAVQLFRMSKKYLHVPHQKKKKKPDHK